MRDFAGRLTALDPTAVQTLKVISYFDALLANGAGLESLVRGAAILTGVAAGAEVAGRTIRIDAGGGRAPAHDRPGRWPSALTHTSGRVWIEREGSAHANDAMVIERLALAVAIVNGVRHESSPGSVEDLLDPAVASARRVAAAQRLHLGRDSRLRIWALSPDDNARGRSAVLPTPRGLLRAVVCVDTDPAPSDAPSGSAIAERLDHAPAAWQDAQLALRLTRVDRPVIRAEDLGAMILLARAFDPAQPLPADVVTLLGLDSSALAILDELVRADSIRHAATRLGMHHSSVQARHQSLVRRLGYDPRAPDGRPRYEAARLLSRLALDDYRSWSGRAGASPPAGYDGRGP